MSGEPPVRVVIRVRDDGPLLVHGEVEVVDAEGRRLVPDGSRGNIALCRCGRSAGKPWCDGAHRGAGFVSRVRAADAPGA